MTEGKGVGAVTVLTEMVSEIEVARCSEVKCVRRKNGSLADGTTRWAPIRSQEEQNMELKKQMELLALAGGKRI